MNLHDRLIALASSPAGRRMRVAGGALLVLAGAQLGGGAGHALVAAVPTLLGTCA
ncbi:MAG: hypothetical protein RDU83_05360 [bacterium]|nr:hypothetical protein [bacterium]